MEKLLTLSIKDPQNGQGNSFTAPPGSPTEGLSGKGGKVIGWGIEIFLIVATLAAFAFLIYGGYLWISSNGDKTKVEGARKTIIFAIVGLILCFLSFFLVMLFGNLFGIDLLNLSL